jgi:hypothetical protein
MCLHSGSAESHAKYVYVPTSVCGYARDLSVDMLATHTRPHPRFSLAGVAIRFVEEKQRAGSPGGGATAERTRPAKQSSGEVYGQRTGERRWKAQEGTGRATTFG